jgi:hypothetical protein
MQAQPTPPFSGPGRLPPDERERLGRVLAACELQEVPAPGSRRHHYFRAVLRDEIGNLWSCSDQHASQDEAHSCARDEHQRRVLAGQLTPLRRPR